MTIAGTGHRPNKLGNDYTYTTPLSLNIKQQIREILFARGCTRGITGLALGFDTMLALILIEMNIPFDGAIPFEGQDAKWAKESKDLYRYIISHPLCTPHIISPGGFTWAKYDIRNRWMVDRATRMIACYDGSPGGTMNCLNYAESVGKPIDYIKY